MTVFHQTFRHRASGALAEVTGQAGSLGGVEEVTLQCTSDPRKAKPETFPFIVVGSPTGALYAEPLTIRVAQFQVEWELTQ